MSFRIKVLRFLDVIMRVPPLLVIDEIFKINMGLPISNGSITDGDSPNTQVAVYNRESFAAEPESTKIMEALSADPEFYRFLVMTTLKFVSCLFGCFWALCFFMLWTRNLVTVYMFIISAGLIFFSYRINMAALALIEKGPCILEDILSLNMSNLLDPEGVIVSILLHITTQWFMGMIFAYIHLGPRHRVIQRVLPFCFLMPLLLAMLPLPTDMLKHIPAFAAVLPLALIKITPWSSTAYVGKTLFNGYQYARVFTTNYGITALLENEWQRLNVPVVLRAFWMIRLCENLVTMIATTEDPLNFMTAIQKLLANGCETLMAVLGMTSMVSIICHNIGKLLEVFLLAEDYEEEKSIGPVSAILFYILALQTGLTSFTPEKRFYRLCRNFCLLFTALFHFLHNIVTPILISLSADRNPSRKRHARALIVCTLLFITPVILLAVLWSTHESSTWLIAVTAFSVEAMLKVLISLSTYTLFLLDARRQTFWEKLDDYVYYVRAFGSSMEFCFGIFLFFNGAWILIFESGGAIRAFMMCIHAYFNIWCEARSGWTVFMKRRMAVKKISSLPEATPMQLSLFDDVCAICYQEMATAKITTCKHCFHGICLRKWLYVQDRCPLCHAIMMFQ